MAFCHICGEKLREHARFCSKCGAESRHQKEPAKEVKKEEAPITLSSHPEKAEETGHPPKLPGKPFLASLATKYNISPWMVPWLVLGGLLILAGMVLLPTKVVSYQESVPYIATDQYTVDVPYEAVEEYAARVPYETGADPARIRTLPN